MEQHIDHLEQARECLDELLSNPPKLPYDPKLLSGLFDSMGEDSRASFQDIAKLVGKSQSLAAKVLAVANSACYGLLSTVTSLDRAIQVIGLMELRSLVLLFGMSESLPRGVLPHDFDLEGFWAHQILTAHLARNMAAWIKREAPDGGKLAEPDSFYSAGLLHDLGLVVLASRYNENWYAIREMSRSRGISFVVAEQEYWGMDHATVGALILKEWKLPDVLVEMVSWHHYPYLATEYRQEAKILAAANVLARMGMGEDLIIPEQVLKMVPEYTAVLNKHAGELAEIINSTNSSGLAEAAVSAA